MKRIENIGYIYYVADDAKFDNNKVGKWIYRFTVDGVDFAEQKCKEAVEKGIVKEAKFTNPLTVEFNPHSKDGSCIACFYLHIDDMETHKKVINFFIENNMIRKTKTGRYYNNSFKLDTQTLNNEYGEDFVPVLKLEQLIDLNTGEWIAD